MESFYEPLEHTADAGIRVWGGTWEELLRNAARAFYDQITDWRSIAAGEVEHVVEAAGNDPAEVLVGWLGELLYLFDTRRLLFGDFEFEAARPDRVRVRLRGEAFDMKRHPLKTEVKAVTHHKASVRQEEGCWTAEVILDL
jgi:SHS2 domain-containing protein